MFLFLSARRFNYHLSCRKNLFFLTHQEETTMKKTLLAIAVLGACAMTAQAANVTLYGAVDGGFMYKNAKTTVQGQQVGEKESSFKFAAGIIGSNKIGIKGEEDIGNAKVGFKLENGFHVANGAIKTSGVLFDREARMYVKGAFGEIAAGRFGDLASAAGTYDLFFANADAFDGADNNINTGFVQSARYNNSLAYQSPEIDGVQGTLMYSFNKTEAQENKFKDNDRYIGAGLTFKHNALVVGGVVEGQIRDKTTKDEGIKNGFTYNLGANYNFDMAKLFGGFQYAHNAKFDEIQHYFDAAKMAKQFGAKGSAEVFNTTFKNFKADYKNADRDPKAQKAIKDQYVAFLNNINKVGTIGFVEDAKNKTYNPIAESDHDITKAGSKQFDVTTYPNTAESISRGAGMILGNTQFDGYAFTIGSQIPFGANKVTVAGYYGNYKNARAYSYKQDTTMVNLFDKKAIKLQVYSLDARYEYSLSKRTMLAAGAGIGQSKIKFAGENAKSKVAQVYTALHHNF